MLQTIPNYITEGKNQLVISIGCTGGKHRSVTLANELYKRLSGKKGYGLKIEHICFLKLHDIILNFFIISGLCP